MNQIIKELTETCLVGFENPSYKGDSVGAFRSHFDWHSSVHAHWMLLSSARITDNSMVRSKIKNRMRSEFLESERNKLKLNPDFELPYGQSWLLLLFLELEKAGVEVSRFRNETVERLIQWLERTDFSEREVNPYQSWLMTFFLMKKAQIEIPPDLINKFNHVCRVRDEDSHYDFFSAESLFHLLKEYSKSEFVWDKKLKFFDLNTYKNSHEVGKIITCSWLTPRCNAKAYDSTMNFIKDFMNETKFWRDDFVSVAHWIPQFLYMGIWLSLGEP